MKTKNLPPTLDLKENAKMSIHFLKNSVDKEKDDLPYFLIDFRYPLKFQHIIRYDDTENLGRWLYGIIYAQRISGTKEGDSVRKAMLREISRRLTGPYGLVYTSEYTAEYLAGHTINQKGDPYTEPYSWLWGDRAVLQGLIMNYLTTGDRSEKEETGKWIKNMVSGLNEITYWKGKYAFYTSDTPAVSYKKPKTAELPREVVESWDQFYDHDHKAEGELEPPGDSPGGFIFPLIQWYEISNDKKALDLAIGISNTVVDYHTLRDSKTHPVGCMSNNHGTLYAVAGVLATTRHVRNRRHIIWARLLFQYYANHCSSSFGWVTENESIYDHNNPLLRDSAEGCAVVDLIRVGIELAKLGFSECWEYVERATRNYLTESQAKHINAFSLKDVEINNVTYELIRKPELCDERDVAERAAGCMAGWGAPNDILDPNGKVAMCVQNCCSSHLPLGLYAVWNNIAVSNGGNLQVNLLLNWSGDLCDIVDYQPYKGRAEIYMKKNQYLSVRMSKWVPRDRIQVIIDGKARHISFDLKNQYIQVGKVSKGSTIIIEYPLRQWTNEEMLGGKKYITEWRGDTVVNIDPPGRFIPIFKRYTDAVKI